MGFSSCLFFLYLQKDAGQAFAPQIPFKWITVTQASADEVADAGTELLSALFHLDYAELSRAPNTSTAMDQSIAGTEILRPETTLYRYRLSFSLDQAEGCRAKKSWLLRLAGEQKARQIGGLQTARSQSPMDAKKSSYIFSPSDWAPPIAAEDPCLRQAEISSID